MFGSRTIKTLTALVVSMTLGTVALMYLDTKPPPQQAFANPLVAVAGESRNQIVFLTEVPLQAAQWRNIIVHSTGSEPFDIMDRCHFVIRESRSGEGYVVEPTPLWKRQAVGHHVVVPGYDYNFSSIGVCVEGDFSRQAPSAQELSTLLGLIQTLQQTFAIQPSNVYLHRQLDSRTRSPGDFFPADTFAASLLRFR